MAFITTNYSNNQHTTNGPLPEGDYEFIINGVQERASKGGNTAINFDLIVRNDLDQALPETNGKQHNRHLFVNEWAGRETQQYNNNHLMYFMEAAGIPEGTNIETMDDFFDALYHKPVRIHVTIQDNNYNGTVTKENWPAPWNWGKSQFPQVAHQFKQQQAPQQPQQQAPVFNNPQPQDQAPLPF